MIILGQIIQIHCTACDFKKDIFVGGGLRDCELETILMALPEDGRRILADAVGQGAEDLAITRNLSVCGSCRAIYALPVVSYVLNGAGQDLYGVCPECGQTGSGEEEGHTVPQCPRCGTELMMRQAGHWD